jgi:hypothetical protein
MEDLSRTVQSGPTGCIGKSGSYAVLPVKIVAADDNNLCCGMQSGFAGY